MIRPLRQLHRRVFLALAVVLPLVIALALIARTSGSPADLSSLLDPGR